MIALDRRAYGEVRSKSLRSFGYRSNGVLWGQETETSHLLRINPIIVGRIEPCTLTEASMLGIESLKSG